MHCKSREPFFGIIFKKYTMLMHLRFYKYIRSSSRRTFTFRLRRQVGKFPVRWVWRDVYPGRFALGFHV